MNHTTRDYLVPVIWCLALAAAVAALFTAAACMGGELPPAITLAVNDNAGSRSAVSDKTPAMPAMLAPAVGVPSTLTPIQQCLAKLTADLTAYEATAGSLTQAQARLSELQAAVASLVASTSAAQVAVAQDQAALAALTNTVVPDPVVPPTPVGPQISVLAITATGNWCPACTALKPTLDAMKAKGEPIAVLDPADAAAAKWNAPSVPTVLMLLDGKEVARWSPSKEDPHISVEQLADWLDKARQWAEKYYPPKGAKQ